ncbi:MAG: O-antigen ligase family protein [Fibrobacterota bacterium]
MRPKTKNAIFLTASAAAALFTGYKIISAPTRAELFLLLTLVFLIPVLKRPKAGILLLLVISPLTAFIRRIYYLGFERMKFDPVLLIPDAVTALTIVGSMMVLNKNDFQVNVSRDKKTPANFLLVFILWLFLKIFIGNSIGTFDGLAAFKFNGFYIFLFFIPLMVRFNENDYRKIAKITIIITFITSLYGLKQLYLGYTVFETRWINSVSFSTLVVGNITRPFSTFDSPAAFADMTVIGLLFIIFAKQSGIISKSFFPLLLPTLWALLISSVRANWFGAIAGSASLIFFTQFKNNRQRAIFSVTALLMLFAFSQASSYFLGEEDSGYSYSQSSMEKDMTDILIKERMGGLLNPLQEYSLQKRFLLWGYAFNHGLRNPLGTGQGSYAGAHSYFFTLFADTGWPGIILFFLFFFYFLSAALKEYDSLEEGFHKKFTGLSISLFFAVSLMNTTGSHIHSHPGDIYYWFLAGYTISIKYMKGAPNENSGDKPLLHNK